MNSCLVCKIILYYFSFPAPPHKFNIKSEMDGVYYNLWSTDNDKTDANDEVVIKSVYDPSPVGYSLPASNAFTGFTTTGGNIGIPPTPPATPEQINAKQPFDKGWYFYTKPGKNGNLFYFPTEGIRFEYSGEVKEFGLQGHAYTITAGNLSIFLTFNSKAIIPITHSRRSLALAVRSAEEKCGGRVKILDVRR